MINTDLKYILNLLLRTSMEFLQATQPLMSRQRCRQYVMEMRMVEVSIPEQERQGMGQGGDHGDPHCC